MKPDQITAQETKNLFNAYNEKLWRVIKDNENCIKYLTIERIKEITQFHCILMSTDSHRLKGLRFGKKDYVELQLQMTPTSQITNFICKGVGELVNAPGMYVLFGREKGERTNSVEIMEKLSHDNLNTLFETCIKYVREEE